MTKFGVVQGAMGAVLWLAVGCGGETQLGEGGDAGPLAACGDNCSPAQIAASCTATCDKIARTNCSISADCPMSCAALPSMAPSCVALADAYLRCLESVQATCSDAGTVQFVGCDSQQKAVDDCVGPTSNPGAGTGSHVPASVCPDIPRPVAGVNGCSGGGGGVSGGGGTVECSASCQDNAGNVWQAECSGSTCSCTYNGGPACTCTTTAAAGTCASCCPGTG
jgi:hypothetical protein